MLAPLAWAMSARNPGAPAVRNITNYHSYVRAVQSGEVEAVRQALERDPSYMQFEATSGPEKWSILWHPVVEGDLEMMTLLLGRGADVACRGARLNGVAEVYTLLQAACVTGRVETLRLLLARGADIGQELEPGAASWTAFSLAAANGHVECLVVAGRRSGHLAAVRRVFDSKDMTRAIARFLARKLRKQRPVQAIRVGELRAAGRLP